MQLFDGIRQKCMLRLHRRYAKGCTWEGKLTPDAKSTLNKVISSSRACKLIPSHNDEFKVMDGKLRFAVKLKEKKCSCKWWEISGIPCKHAIICIGYKRENPEDYVDDYYSVKRYLKAYENVIHPLPQIDLDTEDTSLHMLPPPLKRLPGRPRVNRTRQENEVGPSTVSKRSCIVRCNNCGQLGHNKRSCQRDPVDRRVMFFNNLIKYFILFYFSELHGWKCVFSLL